jgi:outer membrane protein
MKQKHTLTYLCLAAVVPTVVHAQDATPASNFSIGLGAASSASPYRGYDQKVWPIPAVNYDNNRYYVEGLSGGVYLVKDKAFDVSVDATVATNYFTASDTSNPQLKKLKTRDPSLMTGLRFRYRANWGLLQAKVGQDITGNSVGKTAQFEYGFPIFEGALTLIPSVGESWSDSKFNNYYYGVSYAAAQQSGLAYYRPGASWQPYAKVSINYRIGAQWSVFAQARYTRLSSEVSDSPMVDSKELTSYLVGVSYRF